MFGFHRKRGRRSSKTSLLVGVFACSLATGVPSGVHAGSTVNQDAGLWFPVTVTFPISSAFLGFMEVQPRFEDNVSELGQLILRPAIGYKLTDHLSIWQGYAWIGDYQPTFIEENRVFQQVTYKRAFPSIRLQSRTRLEERIIDQADGTAVRFRTLLRGDFPLPNATAWAIVMFDEIFVNLNTVGHGPNAGFNQNRFFLGVNHQLTQHLNMDLGYQMQAVNGGQSGLINDISHIIFLQMAINLP